MDNWLLIIVATIFLVCIVVGYVKGFLKIGISLLSTILTMVIVAVCSPYAADALAKYTPIDDYIESKCIDVFMPEIPVEKLASIDLRGTPLEKLSQEDIANINNENWKMLGITAKDILNVIGEVPKDLQIKELESSPIPQFLKDLLVENNNSAIYGELGVKTFPEYVASYISRLVLNLLSFLVTFLVAIIIVRALMFAVNIIGELPVLGFVNHLGGGVLGAVMGLVIVWILFLAMTLAYSTEIGTSCFEMMERSELLQYLYQANPLLISLLGF